MAAQPQERVRKRLVWFSPFLLFVALSPALLGLTCQQQQATHDWRRWSRGAGCRTASSPSTRWSACTTCGSREALHRDGSGVPMDPDVGKGQLVCAERRRGPLTSGDYWSGRRRGHHRPAARRPGDTSACFRLAARPTDYVVDINPACSRGLPVQRRQRLHGGCCDPGTEQCVLTPVADDTACDFGGEIGTCVSGMCEMGFPCTEQGILDAIALGGGPHTFACDGPTTVDDAGRDRHRQRRHPRRRGQPDGRSCWD